MAAHLALHRDFARFTCSSGSPHQRCHSSTTPQIVAGTEVNRTWISDISTKEHRSEISRVVNSRLWRVCEMQSKR